MKSKKAISLIVLIITIIVMIILASAIIMSLDNTNIFNKAESAVLMSDAKNLQQELNVSLANKKLEDSSFDTRDVNEAKLAKIKEYIPSFPDKYYGIFCIKNGELAYVAGNVTNEEKEALENSGVVKGSYITVPQAEAIRKKSEAANIGTDVSTTDITEYIEGIHEEIAGKFVIYQGKMYYRYEQTTYDERLSLYEAEIPCFMGDVNGDGTLSQEDADDIMLFEAYYQLYTLHENIYYIGDIADDKATTTWDSGILELIIAGKEPYKLDDIEQNPEYLRFYGLCNKLSRINAFIEEKDTIEEYEKEYLAVKNVLNSSENKKIVEFEKQFYFRYDQLTENERTWQAELELPLGLNYILYGDGNFDGRVNKKDLDILVEHINSGTTLTADQQKMLDVNKDGNLTEQDINKMKDYLDGKVEYYDGIVR